MKTLPETRRLLLTVSALVLLPGATHGLGGEAFQSCHERFAAHPDDPESARCFYEVGSSQGHEAQALSALRDLSARYPALGWPPFYLAVFHWGDPHAASGFLSDAAERFRRAGDVKGELLARAHRQGFLFELGRLDDAGREAEAAAHLGELSGQPELLARGRITLAKHQVMVGEDLARAHAILLSVEQSLSPESAYPLHRDCLVYLGTVATELGLHVEARRAYQRLLDAARDAADVPFEAEAWYGLTRIAAQELAEAPDPVHLRQTTDLAAKALAAAEAVGYREIQTYAHWVIGVLSPGHQGQGHLERCIELASRPRDQSYCLNALARRLATTDVKASQRIVQEAVRLAREVGDPWSQAFAWRERMRVSWASGPLDQAIQDAWAALDTIEALRELQEDGSAVQAGLFSTWADHYHWFAGQLLQEALASERDDLLAEAFAVSERLRARALMDWLRAAGKAGAAQRTAQAAIGQDPGFASLTQVRRALSPREALLAFQVAPWEDLAGDFGGGSWVIAVTRRTVRAYPLPGRRELRQAVDLYTGLFEQRDGSEVVPSAHLYRQLLAPALADLPPEIDRLVLVPDDALHRLPFAALRRSAEAEPLATTHRLSLAPSASLWLGWRRQESEAALVEVRGERRAPALVLAAPAPWSAGPGPDGQPASFAAGLPPLVHARREGRAVADALGRGTELARGAAASEALLAGTDLSRFAVLHLAAHAVTDEAHPERSAVVLAPGPPETRGDARTATSPEGRPVTGPESGSTGEDGLLQTAEIAALDLRGKLVVLSSCRSASGTVLRGEGVMSLGRAFFQAGARTVVASLWPVRDDEAAALFAGFYRHLARGETVAAALQAAQADRIAAGAPASAWAAFVALGDGDLAPVTPATPADPEVRLALLAAGAVVAGLLILAAVALRRRLAAALAARRPHRRRPSGLASASPSSR